MNLYQNKEWTEVTLNKEKKKIPSDWKHEKINKLFTLTSSKRVHAKEYVPDGIPFFRGTEITNLKKGIEKFETFISVDYFNQIKNKYGVPKENDFLITAVGTVGSVLLIEKEFDFYFKDGNIIWLRNKNTDNKKYLEYFFNSEYVKNKIYGLGNGSAYNALSIQNLGDSDCFLPECKDEQNAIASLLYSQEKIVQKTKDLVASMEKRNQFMINELLSGSLRVKEEQGQTIFYKNPDCNLQTVKLNDENVMIPNDWNKSNLAKNSKSQFDKPKDNLQYLEIGDIDVKSKKYCLIGKEKTNASAMKFVPSNTLLISTVRPTRLGFTVTKEDLNVSSAFVKITSHIQDYLIFQLYTKDYLKFLETNQGGATYPTIKEDVLLNFEFAIPNVQEITIISKVLKSLFSEKEKYEQLLEKEEKTFTFLLEELMSGRLRIKI